MSKTIGRLCGALGLVLILAVVLVCLPLTAPRLLGYEAYAIVSGSMEPAIPVGSLVYAKGAEPADIAAGDVIVFMNSGDGVAITHRVVENQSSEKQFITKGDANDGNDVQPIPYTNLVGKMAFSVPLLGYVLPVVSTMGGKLSLLGLLAGAVVLRIAGGRLGSKDS